MSSKTKIVLRYGLIGLCVGAAVGLYTVNTLKEEQLSRKFDAKRGAQLGLAFIDFVKKASSL